MSGRLSGRFCGIVTDAAGAVAEIRQRLAATDNVPMGGKPADFARQIEAESAANARIIKAANIHN